MTEIGNLALTTRPVRRLSQLYLGLVAYGLATALMIQGRLGLDPWDVFHQGLSRLLGVRIGWVVIAVGAVVLLAWIPLRQRPGLGTLSNVVLIGLVINAAVEVLPVQHSLAGRITFAAVSILLGGIATGLYIGARLGPGPRDGLMTGLAARYAGRRWASIRLVRTTIEVVVLASGWALGGRVGVATVVYALTIGPLAHVFIPMFTVGEPARRPVPVALPAPEIP